MTLFGESYAAPRMGDVAMFLEAGGYENVREWAADNGFCEVFVRGASYWEHTDRPGEGAQDIDHALIVAVEEQSDGTGGQIHAPKFVVCLDCDSEVERDTTNAQAIRCDPCRRRHQDILHKRRKDERGS